MRHGRQDSAGVWLGHGLAASSVAWAQSAAEWAVEAAKQYTGAEIGIVWEAGLQSLDPLNFSGPKWEELTGIKVKVIEVPTSEMFTKILQEHRAGTGAYVVLEVRDRARHRIHGPRRPCPRRGDRVRCRRIHGRLPRGARGTEARTLGVELGGFQTSPLPEIDTGTVRFTGVAGSGTPNPLAAPIRSGRAMPADDVTRIVLDTGGIPLRPFRQSRTDV